MIDVRKFSTLGAANHGWLDAHHHFSFAGYYDGNRLGWGKIRAWNDDRIAAGGGFAPHSHQDMEIITYVRTGAITHRDSFGNVGRTEAGDVQVMSAGTGVTHSEFNLESEETTLFQIWVLPERTGGEPFWGARPFPKREREGRWAVLASGDAEDAGAIPIRANAKLFAATLSKGGELDFMMEGGRHAYLVPAAGSVRINTVQADTRDGVAIVDEALLRITALTDSELILVET
jgi:quercetin 2,3-dioxygenase